MQGHREKNRAICAEARTCATAKKKSSTPIASDRSHRTADKNTKISNKNSAQGQQIDADLTAFYIKQEFSSRATNRRCLQSLSCFDPAWSAFSQHTDGSLQWIPKQIVAIGEDFHNQVGDGKVKTILHKVRWKGYEKKDDTWEPITRL
jgi:hypothetical protein